jgi:hypothetical protein
VNPGLSRALLMCLALLALAGSVALFSKAISIAFGLALVGLALVLGLSMLVRARTRR